MLADNLVGICTHFLDIVHQRKERCARETDSKQRHEAKLNRHLVEVCEAAADCIVPIFRKFEIVVDPRRMVTMVFTAGAVDSLLDHKLWFVWIFAHFRRDGR